METPPQQDSPELYKKGTTPSDVTPDDSPMRSPLCSPPSTPPPLQPAPKSRNRSAHFSRQLSVDEDRGGDIQMLLEGRGGDYVRPNSWSEVGGGRAGMPHGNPLGPCSIPEDLMMRSTGHKQVASNHKPRERWADSPTTISWTSHRTHNHSPSSNKLLEVDEEKLSNYEMEMQPLKRMDSFIQEIHTQKRQYNKAGPRNPAEAHHLEERMYGVQRLRSKPQKKENFRPATSAEPTVQKLDTLRFGEKGESRLLRRDLTLSPPQKSLPVALESDEENTAELKPTGSAPILVVM
ncbi:hypothetical protein FKM82_018235 [Ascaphus truei]